MIERDTRARTGHEAGTGYALLCGTKRDMPLAFVPLCPAPEQRSRDTAGQMSRSVPLCPAASEVGHQPQP
jgi:hypothetical protein